MSLEKDKKKDNSEIQQQQKQLSAAITATAEK